MRPGFNIEIDEVEMMEVGMEVGMEVKMMEMEMMTKEQEETIGGKQEI